MHILRLHLLILQRKFTSWGKIFGEIQGNTRDRHTIYIEITSFKPYNGYMPRIARIVAAGYPHHITQRRNYRQKIFSDDTAEINTFRFLKRKVNAIT